MKVFEKPGDYAAFERVMVKAATYVQMRLLCYCLMPNHWHLVLQPFEDGDLARYMHRLTTTHVRRWHAHRDSVGYGHLYQGTYLSFPVQDDHHFLTVCRYVERNAQRASLVDRAEQWMWSSLWRRDYPNQTEDKPSLANWPVERPKHWKRLVNQSQNSNELEEVRRCIKRGRPLGDQTWQTSTARSLKMESTLRNQGRPKKEK